MKTELYGGAFDPVHAGHVFVGHETLRLMAFSTLILIPTGLPTRTLTSASPHPMLIVWRCCSLPSQGCPMWKSLMSNCAVSHGHPISWTRSKVSVRGWAWTSRYCFSG